MPHHDNKLSRFEESIMKKANAQRAAILKEIESLQESEVKQAEQSVLHDETRRLKGEMSLLSEEINREIGQRTAEFRQKVTARRNEMTQSVMDEVYSRLLSFAQSGRPYSKWMVSLAGKLGKLYPGEDSVIYVKDCDIGLAGELSEAFGGAEVAVSEDFKIGGMILFHPTTGLIVDESLINILEEQRGYFLDNSGLTGQ